MKSIMEEASTISRAIDQAWNRAGRPSEFNIKILETPERNIFGLTIKSAKIAFFFDEKKLLTDTSPAPIKRLQQKEATVTKERRAPEKNFSKRSRWSDEMISTAIEWIKSVLQIIGLPNITFRTSTTQNGLTFHFKNSLTGNESKDRLLFSSFAYLILSTLRQKYKKAFKNLKVILITE